MSVPRYFMDREGEPECHEEGNWVEYTDHCALLDKVSRLEKQLKHNTDRDYRLGFEDGMRAGLNGGR